MRILIATLTTQRIGGVETYLSDIMPALRDAGYELALACEFQAAAGTESIIAGSDELPVFEARKLGVPETVAAARRWSPDLVYAHGHADPALEEELVRIAPSVFLSITITARASPGRSDLRFPRCDHARERSASHASRIIIRGDVAVSIR